MVKVFLKLDIEQQKDAMKLYKNRDGGEETLHHFLSESCYCKSFFDISIDG